VQTPRDGEGASLNSFFNDFMTVRNLVSFLFHFCFIFVSFCFTLFHFFSPICFIFASSRCILFPFFSCLFSILFRFVLFRFVLFRFVLFRFVLFRFVYFVFFISFFFAGETGVESVRYGGRGALHGGV
jgi:hypothetical protein